jgi:hypothetical protein
MPERAFTGFLAIAPPNWKRPWRQVFDVKDDSQGDITALYLLLWSPLGIASREGCPMRELSNEEINAVSGGTVTATETATQTVTATGTGTATLVNEVFMNGQQPVIQRFSGRLPINLKQEATLSG